MNHVKKNGNKIKNFTIEMEVTDNGLIKHCQLTPVTNTDLDEDMFLKFMQQ